MLSAFSLIFFLLSPARADQSPEQVWESLAAQVRAGPRDLGVRPQRSDARLTVKAAEAILADPLTGLPVLRKWREELQRNLSSEELLGFADALVDVAPAPGKAASVSCPQLPKTMRPTIERLAAGLAQAQGLARQAVGSLDARTREQALAQLSGVALNDADRPLDAALFDRLRDFRQDLMAGAARAAARAVDQALPDLKRIAAARASGRWACASPAGPIVVTGAQGASHDEAELSQSLLVVSLGGKSHYAGPAAAAGAGTVRAVVDLGQAVIESTGPAAGSGLFGVGLLYLPSSQPAVIRAGDFSLGAGFFGIGAAFVAGADAQLTAGRFAEGAGAFGVGLLSLSGDRAQAQADLSAQGFGLPRGAGVFLARGGGGALRCGLTEPDPRETSLAMLSLCQGVGYGPRAFAAGGVGLADVEGSSWTVTSSYFAQGAGYWHGLGTFFISGDGNSLQARRYSQGTGVHMAAGALLIDGSDNHLVNWGVGPAYGWDQGIGALESTGDGNSFQADWSAGRAEFNGRALVLVAGDGNTLRMPGIGTADFKRGAAGYGLADVSGRGNRVWAPGLARPLHGPFDLQKTPWGVLRLEGDGTLDAAVSTRTVAWPSVGRATAAAREARALERLGPRPASPREALRWDLFVASGFPFAPQKPAQAATRLMSLSPEQAPDLLYAFTPENFDEDLWIRVAFSGLGREAAAAVKQRLQVLSGLPRALALGLLRYQPASTAVSAAYGEIGNPDWRVRKEAVSLLGYTLGAQGGEEPGRLSDLQSALSYFSGAAAPEALAPALGRKRPADLLALLALGPTPTPAQRLDIVSHAPSPFDPLSPKDMQEFVRVLAAAADDLGPDFERELREAQDLRNMARSALGQAASESEPDDEVKGAALVALGALGESEDARVIEEFLAASAPALRESAAYGLSELGTSAALVIKSELGASSPRQRLGAVTAAAQSADPAILGLLSEALQSSDESTRRLAAASLCCVQAPLESRRKDFLPALRKLARNDPSSSVRATAAAVAAELWPEEGAP